MASKGNIQDVGKKAVRSTIYTFIGDYFVYIVNFVRGIVLARILLPEVFGIVALAEFFRGLFGQPSGMGYDQALIQRKDSGNTPYNVHFRLTNISAVISFILALIAAPVINHLYGSDVMWVTLALTFLLIIQMLSATPMVYLRKNLAFKRINLIQVISFTLAAIVSISLAVLGYGIWSLVSIIAVVEFTKLLMAWRLSDWRPSRKYDVKIQNEMLKFAALLWFGGLAAFIMLQFDDFLVGQFGGLVMLGFYSKAYTLAQQPLGLFSQVVNKVAAPVIADLQDQPEKLSHGFNMLLRLVFMGTIFIALVLFIWAPEIINLLIGEKWLPMVPMFRGLILYLVSQPIWDMIVSFLTFTGKPKTLVIGQFVQAGLLLSVGSVVVYVYQGIGAALVVSGIVASVTVFYIVKYIHSVTTITWMNTFGYPMLAALISGSTSVWIIDTLSNNALTFWLGVLVLPLSFYIVWLLIFMHTQIREDISFLKARFKS